MSTLSIAPVQWTKLKDIEQVTPLNEADTQCLTEVRDVLKKHQKLERFGVALLHSHFDLQDDEIMLEEVGDEDRTLLLKAVKTSEVGANDIGTIWMLSDDAAVTMASGCKRYCWQGILMGHQRRHR